VFTKEPQRSFQYHLLHPVDTSLFSTNHPIHLNATGSSTLEPSNFISPFSGKALPLLIHKSHQCLAPKMKLLYAIRHLYQPHPPQKAAKMEASDSMISFYHFHPVMLSQVNEFLCRFFWHGIDGKHTLAS
jgi:hypothetical protein